MRLVTRDQSSLVSLSWGIHHLKLVEEQQLAVRHTARQPCSLNNSEAKAQTPSLGGKGKNTEDLRLEAQRGGFSLENYCCQDGRLSQAVRLISSAITANHSRFCTLAFWLSRLPQAAPGGTPPPPISSQLIGRDAPPTPVTPRPCESSVPAMQDSYFSL